MFLKERRAGDCRDAGNSGEDSRTSEETIPEGQAGDSDCESLREKVIGKPYSGKLNVRFDEGELETPDRYSPIRGVPQKFKSGSSPAPALYSTRSHLSNVKGRPRYFTSIGIIL